jgi:hypothetical protein
MSPKDQRYLYRGVNERLDKEREGRLIPGNPGKPFHDYARTGAHWSRCGIIVCGDAVGNEVAKHTSNESGLTSGVSTTLSYEKAKYYATHTSDGTLFAGCVYRIDRELLIEYGVSEIVVADSPDEEVIVVAKDYGELPSEIVISKKGVSPDSSGK